MTQDNSFVVEAMTPFSESLIWQLNQDYYKKAGISAWTSEAVPHHMTSNSMVGKTYAELILGFLKDLAAKGATQETVYILELGAGHGRLAFHILKHLERLVGFQTAKLPPYCYVVSDIVEENLAFFRNHPQFQTYFEQGTLDVAYFDGIESGEIKLQIANRTIGLQDLSQPIIALANYFFDSLPTDLFLIKDKVISACSIALDTKEDPKIMDEASLLKNLLLTYYKTPLTEAFYEDPLLNNLLEQYKHLVTDTHLFFPEKGLQCLDNLRKLSSKGLMLLTMDKGFFETHDLDKKEEPEIITHGSFSLWVNYHALGAFCEKHEGKVFYPAFSNFYLQMGCLLFLPDTSTYPATDAAYQLFVNDFGPDDFNGIKRLTYQHIAQLTLKELISLLRLSHYDSTFFERILPRLKQVIRQVSFDERKRVEQTIQQTWNMYFSISESFDLAYESGGLLYDLGFYKEALPYFQHSVDLFGLKPDIYYNRALCYFQLRQDKLFLTALQEGKAAFPDYAGFEHLDKLDMGS